MPQLQARLSALEKLPIARQWALHTVAEAKRTVARKTGTTGRSIRVGHISDTSASVVVGGAGLWLERGTRPHLIAPRRRRVLAWPAQASGRRLSGRARTATRRGAHGGMVFARRVHHPGTKAQPFLEPAARKALGEVGIEAVVSAWNGAA